jgi:hypothetical protein
MFLLRLVFRSFVTTRVRDLVIELCCAWHNFRVRLTPWQPMISSG